MEGTWLFMSLQLAVSLQRTDGLVERVSSNDLILIFIHLLDAVKASLKSKSSGSL